MASVNSTDFRQLLARARPYLISQNWNDPAFSLEKAFVCSLMAKAAYLEVPDFELMAKSRLKVIPCVEYQTIVESGTASSAENVLRSLDFEGQQFFVIARRNVIVVGMRTPNVWLVSLRGTAYFYDWLINLDARRYTFRPYFGEFRFHRGFFTEAVGCIPPLRSRLAELGGSGVPVYLIGHSLGGALAAVLLALWNYTFHPSVLNRLPSKVDLPWELVRAYAFGMPRYGDLATAVWLPTPYHVYSLTDIVPTVPSSWMGFADCPTEFDTWGNRLERLSLLQSGNFISWIGQLLRRVQIKNHFIETYIDRLTAGLRPSFP